MKKKILYLVIALVWTVGCFVIAFMLFQFRVQNGHFRYQLSDEEALLETMPFVKMNGKTYISASVLSRISNNEFCWDESTNTLKIGNNISIWTAAKIENAVIGQQEGQKYLDKSTIFQNEYYHDGDYYVIARGLEGVFGGGFTTTLNGSDGTILHIKLED